MTLHVFTSRYSSRDPDRLDITRQGAVRAKRDGKPTPGEFLAPSRALLWPHRRAAKEIGLRRESGELTDDEADQQLELLSRDYAEKYRGEMRQCYRTRRAEWDALRARERVVLVCFCIERVQCHRDIAAEILVILGAVNGGELP